MCINYEIEKHPFNKCPEFTKITKDTISLIIGTFPPYAIIKAIQKNNGENSFRFMYYYGSNDSKFWDYFLNAYNPILHPDFETISGLLENKNIGIIDIIYKCRRKNGSSSSDSDLSIIELEDIYKILIDYPNIKKIYFTSYFAYELFLSKILKPLYRDQIKKNEIFHPCDNIINKIHEIKLFGNRDLILYILPSPSPQAFKNQKSWGYHKQNKNKEDFIKEIYKSFINYTPKKL